MDESETESIEFESEVESEEETLRDHRDFKEFEQRIGEFFGRDTTKGGRPTVGEREFREFVKQFRNFGIFQQFSQVESKKSNNKSGERSNKNWRGPLESILGKNFVSMIGDDTIKDTIKKFGPWIMLIAGEWIAEETIDQWPDVLHLVVDFLKMAILMLNAIINFFGGFDLSAGFERIGRGTEKQQTARKKNREKISTKLEQGDAFGAAVETIKGTLEQLYGFSPF